MVVHRQPGNSHFNGRSSLCLYLMWSFRFVSTLNSIPKPLTAHLEWRSLVCLLMWLIKWLLRRAPGSQTLHGNCLYFARGSPFEWLRMWELKLDPELKSLPHTRIAHVRSSNSRQLHPNRRQRIFAYRWFRGFIPTVLYNSLEPKPPFDWGLWAHCIFSLLWIFEVQATTSKNKIPLC